MGGRRVAAWAAIVLGAGCPPFPADGPYQCDSDAACARHEYCDEARVCRPCRTCAELGGACGVFDDRCGGRVTCACAVGESCVGAGEAARCACVPGGCGTACGSVPDGCGGMLSCTCRGEHDRCEAGQCVCSPRSCGDPGVECALRDDCGDVVDCGPCPIGEVCGADGRNACGRPSTCEAGECGFAQAGSGAWCGGCAVGQECHDHRCGPPRPYCWTPMEPFAPLGAAEFPDLDLSQLRGVPVVERGEPWLYLVVAPKVRLPSEPCAYFARARMTSPTEIDPSTYQAIEGLELNLSGCEQPVDCVGYVTRPAVRADGLEVYFTTNQPCNSTTYQTYQAHRASTHDAWSPPKPVVRLQQVAVEQPLLLPDQRTLVFAKPNTTALWYVRRRTSLPSDLDFSAAREIAPFDGTFRYVAQNIACDGRTFLYSRLEDGDRWAPRMADLDVSSSAPVFSSPRPLPVDRVTGESIRSLAESPDCRALYVRYRSAAYVATRCP